ncbi:SCARECROW-LIKE protein 7 [Camellia lanceoleosa]|uniref:SCARECROW-LIKE protein 7 n=1 Tax=Camellia lanceoleosa TaxID=1840588 RepID=A0ACC0GMI1_9ERIC|nr:SCARECROW-LIKE protein 7 [Camellia lanceoleosa]
MCNDLSLVTGNPVERIVYYFAEALRERINHETGKTSRDGQEGCETKQQLCVEEAAKDLQPAVLAWQQELPFVQVAEFTGIQAILDSVASTKRVHFIHFGIRSGINDTVLMQALAVRHECPLELLKITAVATTSEQAVE